MVTVVVTFHRPPGGLWKPQRTHNKACLPPLWMHARHRNSGTLRCGWCAPASSGQHHDAQASLESFSCEPGQEARERLFSLDSTTAFLNHGSYGAAYKLCLEVQQHYRDLLEQQPVRFMESTLLHGACSL